MRRGRKPNSGSQDGKAAEAPATEPPDGGRYLALIIALGGGAMAASHLGKNSVGTRQFKKNAVTTAKIKNKAVTGAKIKPGTITGNQVNALDLAQSGCEPGQLDRASGTDPSRRRPRRAGIRKRW